MGWTAPEVFGYKEVLSSTKLNTQVKDNLNYLKDRELGYAQVTTNQSSITTEVDLTSLSVTVTVPSGARIRIHACVSVSNNGTDGRTTVYIKESTTKLGTGSVHNAVASSDSTINAFVILSPSAGSHTYKLSAEANAGTSNTSSSSTAPSFILVELLD